MKSQDVYALHKAKKNKNDEFYTSLYDIDCEMKYYKNHFNNKIIFCPCDDSKESMFIKHFKDNFRKYNLKKLIGISYNPNGRAWKYEYVLDENNNLKIIETELNGNGDFRNEESSELLKQCNIVVTNPPFSLFRQFISWIVNENKDFIILGSVNAISFKEIFPLLKDNKMWLGKSIHSGDREFRVPDSYGLNAAGCRIDSFGTKWIRVSGIRWFTNLDYKERHEPIPLCKKYNLQQYPKYDNYDAINVDVTSDIPCDYDGVIGVPITYLDKHNPEQFKIIGSMASTTIDEYSKGYPYINGIKKYARILIQKNKEFDDELVW